MPNINISETESSSLVAFDITENTVLVPILYARTYEETESSESDATVITYTDADAVSTLFTRADLFRNFMSGHTVTVDSVIDKSYIMAYELLLQGLNVIIKPIFYDNATLGNSLDSDSAYAIIENALTEGAFDEFKNRNLYNIKFITTGGYSNCGKDYVVDNDGTEEEKTTSMYTIIRELAEARGDAIALVEFNDYYEDEEELFESIQEDYTPNSNDIYAAAFFPWFTFSTSATGSQSTVLMPASFGYLMAYAYSVKFNANWFAAAGTVRGYIPGLIKPAFNVGEALMHTLQGDDEAGEQLNITVNPIYNAGTYGYRVWGNRVVNRATVTADRFMNFLNVRVLLCDIKKQIYHAAIRCTFEPNDDIVWINFKTLASSLLDKMKSGRGIAWYKWTKEVADTKATIKATLTIRPIEAVESFDIHLVLTDEEVTIEDVI